MTVSATNSFTGPLVGNGATTAFPFTFDVGTGDEVAVIQDGVLVSANDYTVTLNAGGNGGTVTYDSAPTADAIYISSDPDFTQQISFQNAGKFLPESHDEANDASVRRDIFLRGIAMRTMRAPVGETMIELPSAADRTNKIAAFDDDGQPVATEVIGSGSVTATVADGQLTVYGNQSFIINGELSDSWPLPVFTPELFGAVGDGVTNDTTALNAMAAAVTSADGGTIEFSPGATYLAGGQTMGAAQVAGRFTGYTGVPDLLMEFANCTQPIIIRGNGAKIKIAPGLNFGTFDDAGVATVHAMPYTGNEIAAAYSSVISLTDCSGFFHCEHLEIDGSADDMVVGGPWGDSGWQIDGVGIRLINHSGGAFVLDVHCHHHTLDGIYLRGYAVDDAADYERIIVRASRFNYCSRLGAAIVGGRGFLFEDCELNWNGNYSVSGTTISSSPASGVDIEAEGGLVNLNHHFSRCELVGNQNSEFIMASGPSKNVTFEDCRFVHTVDAGYCCVPAKAGIKFYRCLFAGTVVSIWLNSLNPEENTLFEDCTFSNSDEHSPTGLTGTVNALLLDVPVGSGLVLRRCLLDHDKAAAGANFSIDEVKLVDCTVLVRSGSVAVNGRYSGKTEFIENGGTINRIPGGSAFKLNAGHAEDYWALTEGGVRTIYPANWSREENKAVYYGSAVYDPGNLTAGSSTSTTVTATGAAVGDRVITPSFSLSLGGLMTSGYVSAANTVTVTFFNPTGGAVNLASGTLRVKVVGA